MADPTWKICGDRTGGVRESWGAGPRRGGSYGGRDAPGVARRVPAPEQGHEVVVPVEEDDGALAEAEEDGVHELEQFGCHDEEQPVGAGPTPDGRVAQRVHDGLPLQRAPQEEGHHIVGSRDAEDRQARVPQDERYSEVESLLTSLHDLAEHPQ